MSNANALVQYERLCRVLDSIGWHYRKAEEELAVLFTVTGDDFPMDFMMRVLPEQQLFYLNSTQNTRFPEDKRTEGAVAAAIASLGLRGHFLYDMSDGSVHFKYVESFRGMDASDEMVSDMIQYATAAVDRYNELFLMLAKGMIDINTFSEKA